MKHIVAFTIALFLSTTLLTHAAPISWDFANGVLQPLRSAVDAVVRGNVFQATSTVATSTFPVASSTRFCLGADCRTSWPTGGLSTTTPWTNGNLAFVSGQGSVGSIATGTLTETISGLQFDATRALVGGSAILSLTSGFEVPTTASTTNWNTAFNWGNHATAGYLLSTTTAIGSSTITITSATSSPQHGTNLAGLVQASLARIAIGIDTAVGYLKSGRFFAALTVNGLIMQESWNQVDCSSLVGATQIAADGLTGCDGFAFYEDNTSTLTSTAVGGIIYGRLSTSANTDGAGVFLNSPTAGGLIIATSTPIIEVTARLHTVQNQGTTTETFIGFTNVASAGTTYETRPTIGCWFTASSTEANWRAICQTGTGAITNVNTGIASSTVATGDGFPYRFLIQTGTSSVQFFMQTTEAGALTQVANIVTNVPNTTALNAGVHFGRASGAIAVGVDVYDMNIGWRKALAR
jgi:hypothetical protein